jgi:hypothetical protein
MNVNHSTRYNKIGFGYGTKIDFTDKKNYPGPGTYEIPSKFSPQK